MPDWLAHLLVPICRKMAGEVRLPKTQEATEWDRAGVTAESPPYPRWALVPTWSPMTHWPAFMVASSKFRSCFSEYLMPMSTPLCSPLVLAWKEVGLGVSGRGSLDS